MKQNNAHGFTMVEIVIALALTALILASLSAALYGLSQGFARATNAGERSDTVNRVSLALRQTIEQARYIETTQEGKLIPSLLGTQQSLDWLAYLPDSSPQGGLHHWNLHVDNGELLLTLTPWFDSQQAQNQEPPASLPPHQILQGVTQFNLSYQHAKTGEWSEQWDDPFLPARIRLELTSEPAGNWPPIIVRLEP